MKNKKKWGGKTNRPCTLTVYNHRERIESFALKPPLFKLHNQNVLVLETTESGKLMSYASSEINLSLNYFLTVIIDCYFFFFSAWVSLELTTTTGGF